MDAASFHRQAMRPAPTPPAPITPEEFELLAETEKADYLAALYPWLGRWILRTAEVQETCNALEEIVTTNEASPPGSAPIIGITGPNAVGKSTAARTWAADFYRRKLQEAAGTSSTGHPNPPDGTGVSPSNSVQLATWSPQPGEAASLIPLVWINLQARSKIAELDYQLLRYLGYRNSGRLTAKTDAVVTAMEKHGIKVLVIDDVHLLKTNHKDGRDVLDHLKHLNTELGEFGGTMVLIGADLEATDIALDPQIARRLHTLPMNPHHVRNKPGIGKWHAVMRAAEEQLGPYVSKTPEKHFVRELSGPLMSRTHGYVGRAAAVLSAAVKAAILDKSFALSADLIWQVRMPGEKEARYDVWESS